jgi:hypothetical protein
VRSAEDNVFTGEWRELSCYRKRRILIGEDEKSCIEGLLSNNLIAKWQPLWPEPPNTARILVGAEDEPAYEAALNKVKAFVQPRHVAWRFEQGLTFGDPSQRQWLPPSVEPE